VLRTARPSAPRQGHTGRCEVDRHAGKHVQGAASCRVDGAVEPFSMWSTVAAGVTGSL
jgi:hypothetical protein